MSLVIMVCGLVLLYFGAYRAWHAAALSADEFPEALKWKAFEYLWQSVALLAVAAMAAINIRPGWPHLRSKWTAFCVLVIVFGLLFPRAVYYVEVKKCLDIGGKWNNQAELCKR
ncbi:MAG: hypothetical protein GWN21_18290 [Gammaproteobacteria bacterium]|nr:hypothetical protein [Gammaproteobacteria bacterium]